MYICTYLVHIFKASFTKFHVIQYLKFENFSTKLQNNLDFII